MIAIPNRRRTGPRLPGRLVLCALLLARPCAAAGQLPGTRPTARETVELIAVIDGDGLRVRRAGREESLRLACVDCEEALHPAEFDARDKPQTVFGEETRLWLTAWLEAHLGERREFEIESDAADFARDGFGRLLAHVRLPGEGDLGLALVRGGRSPYFCKYGTCPRMHAAYLSAEAAARAEQVGIWSPATNRPAHEDAPAARRDYTGLCAWWRLRAGAVAAFRAARAGDALGVVAGDDPAGLARAAAAPTPPALFVEVVSVRRERDGSLALGCAGGLLRLLVPADRLDEFADLDLARRSWSGHQNYLWVRARPERRGDGFRVRCTAAGELAD